jgi:signal transduction histidine kinase
MENHTVLRLPVWRRTLLAVAAVGVLCSADAAWAQTADTQKKILVLYSTGRDAAISVTGERELPRLLDRGLARRLDYHSEYIDAGRFPDPAYQAGFRDFLRLKYGGLKFDAVIAILDTAVEFLHKHRDELFPGSPVVFYVNDPVSRRIPGSTGAVSETDFGATLRLATALQPEITRVFVVTGSGARDRVLERRARSQFARFEPQLSFTYLAGLPTAELQRRLADLPSQSIVYYVLVYRDGTGQLFQPIDYLDRIAGAANRPIYSWTDSTMDHGVVGGSMHRQQGAIDAVAALTLRVLAGEPADSIPVVALRVDVTQVDWRQLRRWGIDDNRVPAGTVVRFREYGPWQRYKGYILGAGALLLAQTALIVALVMQAVRRRKAEALLRRSQAEVRRGAERIRDLGRRLFGAQEAERSRIARELHDDVSQRIAILTMDLQLLAGFGSEWDAEAEKLAREALERADGIMNSLRDLSRRLHPAMLRLIGLVAALHTLQRELSRPGMSIVFSHEGVPPTLPDDLALGVFRVVQEALQNAARHSGARNVSVRLQGEQTALTVTVVDDGRGFDLNAARGKGLGLVSMSERLETIGGLLTIRTRPNEGTRLEMSVPLPMEADRQSLAV